MDKEQLIDVTRVSDKGQVVIPKDIRERLGMTEGTKLIVLATEDAVILQKIELVGGNMKIKQIVDKVKDLRERLALGR
jgi:AbrB family looped-hinge helix DNA binding protein